MEPDCYALLRAVEDVHWWHVSMRRLTMEWAAGCLPLGGRALDVGCGTGRLLADLRRWGKAYGVDCSSLAANVWWQAGIVGVAQGAAQRLPFPDAAFDLVTCLDVLYHRNVPDDLLVLQEIARVLRPRGALILRVPALAWICTARDERFHTRRRYGRRQLQERVSAAGFVIERLSYANALLLPLAIAQRWLGQCCPAWADAGDRVPPKVMNRLAEAVLHGEAWWLRRRNLGWGLSLVCRARRISEGANQRFEE